jgi:predicted small metal-binding protein
MGEGLRTSCVCGWETIGTADEVIAATLDHGRRVHNMEGTADEVRARAQVVEIEEPAGERATS